MQNKTKRLEKNFRVDGLANKFQRNSLSSFGDES